MHLVLETVTPLFLGGPDQQAAEIRAPSFRGALRFWLRALAGGVLGDADRDSLRKLEVNLFGDTTMSSSLIIRITQTGRPVPFLTSLGGINYLFFSLKMQKRPCLPVGLQFPLTITIRPGPNKDQKGPSPDRILALGLCSLWLLVNLGGLGARSRRGAGNLQIVRIDGELPEEVPSLTDMPKSARELAESLSAGLTLVRKTASSVAGVQPIVTHPVPSQFPLLHSALSHAYVLDKVWPTWEQALDEVGRAYRAFRARREPDYAQVKGLLRGQSSSLKTVQRAGFGLPLQFSYRSLGRSRARVDGKEHDRSASRLFFKVHRLATGEYSVLCLFFRTRLLPKGEKLRVKADGREITCSQPELSIIETFVEGLSAISPLLEVAYE